MDPNLILFICVAFTLVVSGSSRDISCGSSTHFTIGFTDTKEIICATTHITLEINNTIRYTDARDREFNVLEFYGCNIHTFPSEVFNQFDKLTKVKMIGNDVRKIADHSFEKALALKELNLNRNKLEEITANTFKGAQKLTYLSLEHNNIRNVSVLAFDTLYSLEILYLAYNLMKTIQIGLFTPLVNLKEVYLYNNKIVQIHPKSFWHNRALHTLDLDGNYLEKVNIHINSHKLDVLDLTNNEIIELSIEGNSKNSTSIRKILASNNRLVTAEISTGLSMEVIDLNRNMISSLDNISFPRTLQSLNLAFNPIKVVSLNKNTDQMNNLHQLDLSYTDLDLEASAFANLKYLSVLYLKGLRLNVLPSKAFQGLDNLRILNLQDNDLKFLDYDELTKQLPRLSQFSIQTDVFPCAFLMKFYDFLNKSEINLIPDEEFSAEGFNFYRTLHHSFKIRKDCENFTQFEPVIVSDEIPLNISFPGDVTSQTLSKPNRYYTFKLIMLMAISMIIIIFVFLTGKCNLGPNYIKFRNPKLSEQDVVGHDEFNKV